MYVWRCPQTRTHALTEHATAHRNGYLVNDTILYYDHLTSACEACEGDEKGRFDERVGLWDK